MESKVVVVTGGSSGIGAAIALHLCEIGYRKLVIVARRGEKLREVADQCQSKANDVDILILELDLSLEKNNEEVVRKTLEYFGSIV
jgi:NADP-dependent 3-hydroxy acid dehydrogenase YdfG